MNLKLLDCEDLVMLPESREFVEYFVNHPERIGIIYQAEDPDCDVSNWGIGISLDNNLTDLFQNQIANIPHDILDQVANGLCLSVDAKNFLLETYNELCALPELTAFLGDVGEAYISTDAALTREPDEEFSSRLEYITSLTEALDTTDATILDVLCYLCDRFPTLMESWESSSISASLAFISFLEVIGGFNKTPAIRNEILQVMDNLKTKLQKAIVEAQEKRKLVKKTKLDMLGNDNFVLAGVILAVFFGFLAVISIVL
jgi:hypothetical protein